MGINRLYNIKLANSLHKIGMQFGCFDYYAYFCNANKGH